MAASARTRLRRKLLRIGGVDVDFIEDPYLQVIADAGALFVASGIRIMRGRPNECHRNAAVFWLKGKCAAIAIGYYLGPDSARLPRTSDFTSWCFLATCTGWIPVGCRS